MKCPQRSLDSLLEKSGKQRAGSKEFPVLSITMHSGLVDQSTKFKKRVASLNTSSYKIVFKNELVVGFPIDEGVLGFQTKYSAGIVSPAYDIWKLKKPEETYIPYLERYLRSNQARQRYATKMQGAVARRRTLTKDDFLNLAIPFPPLDDQKRIAHLLGTVDGLLSERKKHLQQLDDLLQSVFLEMFGDPVRNKKGWSKPPLSKFGILSTGNTPPRNDKKNYSSSYIEWIKTNNILVNFPFVTRASEYLSEYGSKNARVVTEGALMVACIAGSIDSIGRAALTNRKVAFNQQINAIQPYDDVNSFYLYSLFKICKPYIQSFAAKGMKKILTKGVFGKIPMIKPPHDLQNKFAAIVEKVEGIKQHYQHSLSQLENLYGVLSQKAFKGELDLSRVPMPVEVVEGITYDNSPQPQELDLEAIANFAYTAAQYIHKAAQAIAPRLAPLVAAIYESQAVLDAQSTLAVPHPALELSVYGELPTANESKTRSATDEKRELHAIFTAFIKELGSITFSMQDFIDALSQELEDMIGDTEQAQRVKPLLYEEVKSWIFDSLATGTLQQAFDDEKDNAVYLRTGRQL